MVEMNLAQKRLMFTTDSELAIRNSEVVFIAVGTPSDKDGKADLSAVMAVVEHIAKYMDSPKVVVVKSTVPVGTCHKLRDVVRQKMRKPVEFDVVSNPEFLREGEAVNDFMVPDRVVVDSLSALSIAFEKEEIYRKYLRELFEALEASKAVSFVLSETEQNPKVYSRTGVEEFLADGVIVLYNMKKDGKRENALEILKLRSSRHRKGLIPYTFSKTGIDIMPKTL